MRSLIKILLIYTMFCFIGLHLTAQEDLTPAAIKGIQKRIDFNINCAQNNMNTHEYYKAQDDLKLALQLAQQIQDHKNIGLIYSKIGKLYYLEENPDEAIKTLIIAIDKQRVANDNVNIAETYKTLGLVYLNQKKAYNDAINYLHLAETLFKNKNLKTYEIETKMYKAEAYFGLKNYAVAQTLYKDAIQLSKAFQNDQLLSTSYLKLAQIETAIGHFDEADNLANLGFEIAKKNNYIHILNIGYKIQSNIKEALGNYKASYILLKKHLKINDSLLKVKRAKFTDDRKLEYLYENPIEYPNEREADLQKEMNPSWLEKLATILSIALISILSLLTLSLYKNNNIRRKSNDILQQKNVELIKAMEKAELATKTKANFLSTVTHELRTPLYAVTGLTNILLEEHPKPEQLQHLKSLKISGEYLLTFISNILQINKIEANKVAIEPENFNLKKKVNDILSVLNNSALDNKVNIHFEYDYQLARYVYADQLKISQILINLIGNAIKFTKDGDIWIRIKQQKAFGDTLEVRFEIEDNGIGISQEKQQSLFESFAQGSIQINRKYGGTGLGLFIVKGLIDILKGKIYLKSELGKGSTFYFELPLKKSSKKVKKKKATNFINIDKLELSNIKILVVDDNKINQMITTKILDKMGLHCDVVDNGEEAVDKVKTGHYNVVLMDIHMPGISGIEATKMIRAFNKKLTIFALTAVTIEDKIREFNEAGFTDIIPKPFKLEDFKRKLCNALTPDSSHITQKQNL